MVREISTWQITKTNYLKRYIWAAVRPQLRQIQTRGLKTSFGEKSCAVPHFSFPLHTVFIWTSHFVTSLAKALVEAWHQWMLWVFKRTHKHKVAETHAAVSFHFLSKRFALVCIMTSQIWPDKEFIQAHRLFRKGNPLATVNFSFWHDWQVVDLVKELGAVSISRKQGWVWT